MAEFPRK